MEGSASGLVQFEPLSSAVDAIFWHQLSEKKVDLFRLDDSAKPIDGYYVLGGTQGGQAQSGNASPQVGTSGSYPPRLCLGLSAFGDQLSDQPIGFRSPGTLRNLNTIEDFKGLDKAATLKQVAQQIWDGIVSGSALNDPSVLTSFLLVTFADLKKYKFYYWFGFPALLPQEHFTYSHASAPVRLKEFWLEKEVESLRVEYEKWRNASAKGGYYSADAAFFLIKKSVSGVVTIGKLSEWEVFWNGIPDHERTVGYADPGSLPGNPGWPLRNFLLLLKKQFSLSAITVICYRENMSKRDLSASIALKVDLPGVLGDAVPKSVGWEKNASGKLGPRFADLGPLMDPFRLAQTAVDLNLKLMRWRIMPDLQLEKISAAKCLLVGAGTLGCYVARALLAWGVRHITLVDNGTVSFSNPVRQPLFNYDDSLDGGKPKAAAAAEALKRIFPGVTATGHNLSVPMPGHPPTSKDACRDDIELLHKLIESHDVIYLLTDSREARWLPTVIGASLGKIVINSALGFDTFLVMRHGMRTVDTPEASENLGCYYCSDVVAPRDSLTDRTLDQQCTVTRPGLSLLASGQAVELMVSILNHPKGGFAPADAATNPSEPTKLPFGIVPHQIRGFLTHFTNLIVTGLAYDKCTACSPTILNAYKKEGDKFVLKVLENPKLLEELTGLNELYKESDEAEVDWIEGEEED
ncbi:hypothetical protein DFJ73DRAFT_821772 [Zopfochytrium polystomum]|nr:hypothetical protein DFJ73DRAFT_821772 [Zopfochytrium polystomum]